MALSLKAAPPGKGPVRSVDGGVALRHRASYSTEERHWVAYTAGELTPVPDELFCPGCGQIAPVRPQLKRWLKGLLGPATSSTASRQENTE